MPRTPTLVYTDHIEFICIVMQGNEPDPNIPPRPYTAGDLRNAVPGERERGIITKLMLYHAYTDEDGDIWVRVANPQT